KDPAVAGTFYPADKDSLKKSVDEFLSKAEKVPANGKLLALISPHAGYVFSGQVAAYGYKQIQGGDIKKVILIGPSHQVSFKGASIYTKGSFKTPLGDVKINGKIAEDLLNETADVRFYPEAFEKEHSVEVQLPFLQRVLKDFTIVPILISSPTKKTFEHLVSKLTDIIDEKTLLVASTDLSHYHDYSTAKEMDSKVISAIERLSITDIIDLLGTGKAELCGGFPVIIVTEVARRSGANLGVVFKYANSGDVTGEKDKVVGYASIGLYKSPYTEEEKKELLALARNAITEYVTHGKVTEVEIKNPKFRANGAVFVTIKNSGNLRGCIGHIQAVMPLYESIRKNAVAACSSDPRFPPMKKEELKDMDIEISILSPFVPLKDVKDIQVGKHGLYIMKGMQSGLLLPQVATEFRWDRNAFLENVCMKAGLPKDAWKDADLYTFTAEILR
ncbi:MAG TPA: AmmeMemoRadiSam system protein B, partial [Thermodesulfovibrionales bacterium]|nr:AmmeMemoRadiSam system protein B [Thermodesulfovibrionales bacterium]